MIPRMTTVGTLKNYRYDLNRTNNNLAKAMQTVTTQRNFNSYAENPALTVRCFQIRRSYQRAEAQYTVNESLRHKYDVAWEALGNVSTDLYALAADTSLTSVIESLNDPTGPGRTALGQSLCAKAKDMVQTMNGRYGENYVFSGADTLNAPFTWGPKINVGYIEDFDPNVHPEYASKTPDEIEKLKNLHPDDPKYTDPTNPEYGGSLTADEIIELNKLDPENPKYKGDATNPKHAAMFQFMVDPEKVNTVEDGEAGYSNDKLPKGTLYTNDLKYALYEKTGDAMIYPDDPGDPSNPADYPPSSDPENPDIDAEGHEYNPHDKEPVETPVKNPAFNLNFQYKYVKVDGTGTNNADEAAESLYYRRVPTEYVDQRDEDKLKYFEDSEAKYIDVGLGHKEENDEALASTVFDSALQGTDFLGGYGTKTVEVEMDDGTKATVPNIPNNLISVVNEMGLVLRRCSVEDGAWASEEDQQRFMALVKEFEAGTATFRERWTEMDTQSGFLRDNSELLADTSDSLIQQYMELEAADPAAAISEYMFARYCFDAALKVGNSILSQSLMDYMSF